MRYHLATRNKRTIPATPSAKDKQTSATEILLVSVSENRLVPFSRPGSPVTVFIKVADAVRELLPVVVTGCSMVEVLKEVIVATEVIVAKDVLMAELAKMVESLEPVTVVGTDIVTVCMLLLLMRDVIQDGTGMMISGLDSVAINETEDHAAMMSDPKRCSQHHKYGMDHDAETVSLQDSEVAERDGHENTQESSRYLNKADAVMPKWP